MMSLPVTHPVLRVLAVLLVSLSLALDWARALLGVALLTALLLPGVADWRGLWRALYRLRWLMLSLLLLHAYFTPGPLLWPHLERLSPSAEGLRSGAGHGAALLLMVIWSWWMCQGLRPDLLAHALLKLLSPLAMLGVPLARFARRLSLTLHGVALIRERVAALRDEMLVQGPPSGRLAALRMRAEVLSRLFENMDQAVLLMPAQQPHVAALPRWTWWDGACLMMLSALLLWVWGG